jgi:prefoldin subunit 5
LSCFARGGPSGREHLRKRLAEIKSVIRLLREEISALDSVIATLEDIAASLSKRRLQHGYRDPTEARQ